MNSNVSTLPPGGYLRLNLSNFQIEVSKYFEVSDLIDESYYRELNNSNCESILQDLLRSSIKKRLMSDVPVAIIASGGLDSSLISHFANDYGDYNLLHVNSVDDSELNYANSLAKDLNVRLHSMDLNYDTFVNNLDDTLFYWEYPLVHNNAVGILQVSKLAREQGYKVLLGGEGADELFGGYPYHQLFMKANYLSRFLKFVPTQLNQALIYARTDTKSAGTHPTIEHILVSERFKKYEQKYSFVSSEHERKMLSYLASELEEYLVPLLSRADRMSMSHGVEMRLPFLDIEVIRFALNLPLRSKLSLSKSKIILRNIGKSILSPSLIDRPKTGFTVNYSERFLLENGIDELHHLNKYFDSKNVIRNLYRNKQYHKIMKLYTLDKILKRNHDNSIRY
ncbi:asparagine synthetase B family protein [Vibrio brasiliensis]|nr:asparagine synthase C-terminal domain-containing protein [Vibrio brasiliensis]